MNIVVFLLLFRVILHVSGGDILVEMEQGTLRGEALVSIINNTYYSFKGIPYAQTPIGSLRFKAPQPPSSWEGIRNATAHGPVCVQVNIFDNNSLVDGGSEDCLFLNVYTPDLAPDSPLAVIVFIHGGGYTTGSGNVDYYGPDFIVDKDIVLVTLNYRLGALGFLSMDTEDVPGNAGLKDQVAALKWVQTNIGAFGGDPLNVTLMGQSAGSASVAYHILSTMSRGLFKRAIAMSGVPFCDFSVSYQHRMRAFMLGKELGLDTEDEDELLTYLQSVNATSLVGTLSAVVASEIVTNNLMKVFSFVPVVEKNFSSAFLAVDPATTIKSGNINPVDIMFGHTDQETVTAMTQFVDYLLAQYNRYAEMLVPVKILFHNDTNTILNISSIIKNYFFGNKTISVENMPEFINYENSVSFTYDITRFFSIFPKFENTSMYSYIFSSVSDRNIYGVLGQPYGIVGAGHQDDLNYIFQGTATNSTVNANNSDLIEQAVTVFTNFAKYGNPTANSCQDIVWPQFDNVTKNSVNIGSNLTVVTAAATADLTFWESIFDYAGLEFW